MKSLTVKMDAVFQREYAIPDINQVCALTAPGTRRITKFGDDKWLTDSSVMLFPGVFLFIANNLKIGRATTVSMHGSQSLLCIFIVNGSFRLQKHLLSSKELHFIPIFECTPQNTQFVNEHTTHITLAVDHQGIENLRRRHLLSDTAAQFLQGLFSDSATRSRSLGISPLLHCRVRQLLSQLRSNAPLIHMYSAIWLVLDGFVTAIEHAATSLEKQGSNFFAVFKECTTIIEREQCINSQELGAKLNMSVRTLDKIFKKYANQSTAQYIREHKLEKIETMLQTGKYSLSSLAKEFGYSNKQSLSRALMNRNLINGKP